MRERTWDGEPELRARVEEERAAAARQAWEKAHPANGVDPEPDWILDPTLLRGADWLTRDIPKPDFLLGELLSTTSRAELIGPTGIGKSNFLLAISMPLADGISFLHWSGSGRPRRVLYIDGEMSRRLAKQRLEDAARRHRGMPETFFYLNREDFENFQPLNIEAGQKFVDTVLERLAPVDLIIFDNTQALLLGDMKDEEPWQNTLPWVRSLTQRTIGQVWAHHTGHDETHGYGTKTREWQLDIVGMMERAERPECDIAFKLSFSKARERSPDNRHDFEPALITLHNDAWTSTRGEQVRIKRVARDRLLELLQDAITRDGVVPPPHKHIPPHTPCVTEKLWRTYSEQGSISEGSPDAFRMAFNRAAKTLLKNHLVGKFGDFVWIIK